MFFCFKRLILAGILLFLGFLAVISLSTYASAAKVSEGEAMGSGTAKAKTCTAIMNDRTSVCGKPSASGLKAGFADDNKQFNYFIQFLKKYAGKIEHYVIPVDERIVLKVKDREGKPVAL